MVTDTDFEEKATRLIITADEKQQEAANSESDVEDTMLALLDQQRKVQKQIIERLPSQPNTNGSLSLDDMFTQLDLDASSASKLALLSKPMGQNGILRPGLGTLWILVIIGYITIHWDGFMSQKQRMDIGSGMLAKIIGGGLRIH